jgi:hypothetical protein
MIPWALHNSLQRGPGPDDIRQLHCAHRHPASNTNQVTIRRKLGFPGLVEYLTFKGVRRSSTASHITRDRLLYIQSAAFLPLHRDAGRVNWSDLPDHYRLLQLLVLPSNPHQIHHPARAPTNALLPTHCLAVVRYACSIFLPLASVLARLASFPDSLLEPALAHLDTTITSNADALGKELSPSTGCSTSSACVHSASPVRPSPWLSVSLGQRSG